MEHGPTEGGRDSTDDVSGEAVTEPVGPYPGQTLGEWVCGLLGDDNACVPPAT